MQNAIYSGFVIHNRLSPKSHIFKYKITMFFLDVDNVDSAFEKNPFVSVNKFNFISFNRNNYMPSEDSTSIRDEIIKQIRANGYVEEPDKIYILTHLGYFGYCYNPVSFFYCYSKDEQLLYFLAEVNNTPWNERYVYFKKCDISELNIKFSLDKKFHVSPFLPMDMTYKWDINTPKEIVYVSMKCYEDNILRLTASFKLSRNKLSAMNCFKALLKNPLATQLLHYRIYWQALKLLIKRTPFFDHKQRN